jgi:hypothetical protein
MGSATAASTKLQATEPDEARDEARDIVTNGVKKGK